MDRSSVINQDVRDKIEAMKVICTEITANTGKPAKIHKRIESFLKMKYQLTFSIRTAEADSCISLKELCMALTEQERKLFLNFREKLYSSYLHDKTIPTINTIDYKTSQCLGFVWRKIPNTEKAYVIENTEIVYDRHLFFNRVQENRREGKTLVYIIEMIRRPSNTLNPVPDGYKIAKYDKVYRVAASPDLGLIDAWINKSVDFDNNFLTFNDWVLNNVVPNVPKRSVFIFDSPYTGQDAVKFPKMHAKKMDMIKWLQLHDIPHHSEMSRAELYQLASKFKLMAQKEIIPIDEMLKSLGIEVMRRPAAFGTLDFYLTLRMNCCNNDLVANKFLEYLRSKDVCRSFGDTLMVAEKTLVDEDRTVESLIEKLLLYVRNCPNIDRTLLINLEDFKSRLSYDEKVLIMM